MRAMLPHVDELRPVHSLDALADLCSALTAPGRSGGLAAAFRHAHMKHAPEKRGGNTDV